MNEPPDSATLQLLIDGGVAIGIGLLIGLEREHHETAEEAPRKPGTETLLGVRTFALVALFGWLAGVSAAAHSLIPVAALLVVGALVLAIAFRFQGAGRGVTTEVAALATFLLGMLVHHQRTVAVAFGLATMVLLISKPWFRTVIPKMRRMDLTSTVQLLVLLAIVLPMLPTEARDPWGVLSPRRLGIFVSMIAGISYVGYLLHRMLGSQRGAGLTGLVGGLASSTAVTAAMAQQAKAAEAMVLPGQLAVFLASTTMFGRVLVISALIDPRVAWALAAPLGVMAAGTLVGALWKWRAVRAVANKTEATLELQNPFSLLPVLKWGVLFAAVLVASAAATQWFGGKGLYLTAVLSGFVDVDAINLAASEQAAGGEIAPAVAAIAVILAVVANTFIKAGIAWVGGGRRFGAPVTVVFGSAALAGLGLAVALRQL